MKKANNFEEKMQNASEKLDRAGNAMLETGEKIKQTGKTIKDTVIGIFGLIVIVLLVKSCVFGGSSKPTQTETQAQNQAQNQEQKQANNKKHDDEQTRKAYPGETLDNEANMKMYIAQYMEKKDSGNTEELEHIAQRYCLNFEALYEDWLDKSIDAAKVEDEFAKGTSVIYVKLRAKAYADEYKKQHPDTTVTDIHTQAGLYLLETNATPEVLIAVKDELIAQFWAEYSKTLNK